MKSCEASGKYFPIRFGTDGWRAVIGDQFTFANLERVAQAYADFLLGDKAQAIHSSANSYRKTDAASPLVIIGYDRRFMSQKFAERVAEVIQGNNLRAALFTDAAPTPLISWAVRESCAAGGIVITASHNPAEYNGFKIKVPCGGSAPLEITRAVEKLIDKNSPLRSTLSVPDNSSVIEDAIESYRKHVADYIDLEKIRDAQVKIVVDSMHGAGGNWMESFLRQGNIEAETIRSTTDPLFGGVHPEPIDSNLMALKNRVKQCRALIGLATDGDADRLGVVNESGRTMTMHEVVPILLLHLIRNRKMNGGVIRTFSQSVLTKRIAAAYNLPLYETPIGFKYISELMLKENILLGAEESGGIGVQGHIPERDGIFNGLLLLEAVIAAGKKPSEIVAEIHREFGEFYFDRADLKMDVKRGKDFAAQMALNPPVKIAGQRIVDVKTDDGTKLLFNDESWLLFRQSGTESVLRIYSEATTQAKTRALLEAGQTLALKK